MNIFRLTSTFKVFLFLGLMFLLTNTTNAQPLKYAEQNFGIGLGVPAITNYSYTSLSPAITANYEYGFSDKLGIGYIGGGGLVSFAGSSYDYHYINAAYTSKYRYFLIGPRAAYHFDMRDITGSSFWNKCDLYAGVFMGFRFQTHKYYAFDINNEYVKYRDTSVHLASDIFAGIRYAFNNRFGIYAETGFGVTYLTVGVSWRF